MRLYSSVAVRYIEKRSRALYIAVRYLWKQCQHLNVQMYVCDECYCGMQRDIRLGIWHGGGTVLEGYCGMVTCKDVVCHSNVAKR